MPTQVKARFCIIFIKSRILLLSYIIQKQREALGTISSEAERAYYVADSIYTEVYMH